MNTSTIAGTLSVTQKESTVPVTARGRALYTIDWFANGKPVLDSHDALQISITQISQC